MPDRSRVVRLGAIVLAAGLLAGCGGMSAQNPGGSYSPVNAVSRDNVDHLLLSGADVVAYFIEDRHVPGSAEFRSEYEGVDLHFASAANQALFDADPTRYLPQYGGYCANGVAFGIPWGGNAEDFLVHEGRLYIFGGETSKQAFLLDLDANLALSDRYWREEIAGGNSFWQRGKRLVFRVPHYQTGEEQAAAVRAAG
jgi:YHS domain-containing protein